GGQRAAAGRREGDGERLDAARFGDQPPVLLRVPLHEAVDGAHVAEARLEGRELPGVPVAKGPLGLQPGDSMTAPPGAGGDGGKGPGRAGHVADPPTSSMESKGARRRITLLRAGTPRGADAIVGQAGEPAVARRGGWNGRGKVRAYRARAHRSRT